MSKSKSFENNKETLRNHFLNKRNQLSKDTLSLVSHQLSNHIIQSDTFKQARVIAAYSALGNEPSLESVISIALASNKTVYVPIKKGDAFLFTDASTQNETDEHVIKQTIDLWLIPGIAFSKDGTRLGRGKGWYDRYLSQSSGIKWGISPFCLVTDALPCDDWDVSMNAVITEKGIIQTV